MKTFLESILYILEMFSVLSNKSRTICTKKNDWTRFIYRPSFCKPLPFHENEKKKSSRQLPNTAKFLDEIEVEIIVRQIYDGFFCKLCTPMCFSTSLLLFRIFWYYIPKQRPPLPPVVKIPYSYLCIPYTGDSCLHLFGWWLCFIMLVGGSCVSSTLRFTLSQLSEWVDIVYLCHYTYARILNDTTMWGSMGT